MKKMHLAFCVAACVMALGCSNPHTSSKGELEVDKLTKVIIPLPSNGQARSVGLEETKTYVNYYEAHFRKNNGSYNYVYYLATATSADTYIEVSIPVGTYDILLLAGYDNNSTKFNGVHPYPLLLASAQKENISITMGAVNQVSMELATIDVDLLVDSTIDVASEFFASIVIDTKNTFIAITMANSPSIEYNNGSNGGRYYHNNITAAGNTYTVDFNTFTAPLAIGNGTMEISIGGFQPFGTELAYWRIADYRDNDLGAYYFKALNFIEGQAMPDVIITITWPD